MWGDDDKKIVVAESLGYDYFHRKDKMFTNICELGFVRSGSKSGAYTWRPSVTESKAELIAWTKKSNPLKVLTMHMNKLVASILRTPIGAKLAKVIGRGPLHQEIVDQMAENKTKPIRDFFDHLVASEKTADEIFLTQIGQTKF